MFRGHDFLWSILVPAGIALAVLQLARFRPGRWWMPIAFGLAFLIAFPGIVFDQYQLPRLPPVESTDWIFVGALILLAAALLDALVELKNWIRAIVMFIASAISVALLLKFQLKADWTVATLIGVSLAIALLAVIWWIAMDSISLEGRGVFSMIACWLIGVCSAIPIMMLASPMYGKLALSLAAVAGAACVATLIPGSRITFCGFSTLFAGLIILVFSGAKYLTEIKPMYLAILALTPLFVLAGHLVPVMNRPWQRGLIRLILIAIPLFTALTIAVVEYNRQPADDSYYYYP
jgi:hypothetical protein